MNIDFPYQIGPDGRTRSTDDADHLRDMIRLLLFSRPGERVMRSDFGSGVLQFVFAPNNPEVAATLQLTIRGALTHWLGDMLDVSELEVEAVDSELHVAVNYVLRSTGEVRSETFVGAGT